MSGPKSGTWCVIQMSEEEARASRLYAMEQLKFYLDCILSFHEKLARLQKEHPEFQIHTDVDQIVEPSSDDAEQIVAELNNRYEIYIRLRDEIDKLEGMLKMREQTASLINRTLNARQIKDQVNDHSVQERISLILKKAISLYETLNEQASHHYRLEIEDVLTKCTEATDINIAELLLTDLRVRIRKANQEAQLFITQQTERRQRDVNEAQKMLRELGKVERHTAESLHELLKPVLSGDIEMNNDIRQRIGLEILTAERQFAGKALKETLEELGYEVLDGFETLFADGGSSYFQRTSWNEHHIRVTVDANSQRLSLAPVRNGENDLERVDQPLRDMEMEEIWCGELTGVLNKLNEKGMEIEFTRRFAPGEKAIEVVADEKLRAANRRRKKISLTKHQRLPGS
jgi:hypothetical protein